jgi:hypothetical protein
MKKGRKAEGQEDRKARPKGRKAGGQKGRDW